PTLYVTSPWLFETAGEKGRRAHTSVRGANAQTALRSRCAILQPASLIRLPAGCRISRFVDCRLPAFRARRARPAPPALRKRRDRAARLQRKSRSASQETVPHLARKGTLPIAGAERPPAVESRRCPATRRLCRLGRSRKSRAQRGGARRVDVA